jgi:hypothetical protein
LLFTFKGEPVLIPADAAVLCIKQNNEIILFLFELTGSSEQDSPLLWCSCTGSNLLVFQQLQQRCRTAKHVKTSSRTMLIGFQLPCTVAVHQLTLPCCLCLPCMLCLAAQQPAAPLWYSKQQQAAAMAALPIPARELFINGRWVAPVKGKYLDVVCPANEAVIGRIPAGETAGASDMHMISPAARMRRLRSMPCAMHTPEQWSAAAGTPLVE